MLLRMRIKSSVWFVAAFLLLLLIGLAVDRHGWDLSGLGAWIHGR